MQESGQFFFSTVPSVVVVQYCSGSSCSSSNAVVYCSSGSTGSGKKLTHSQYGCGIYFSGSAEPTTSRMCSSLHVLEESEQSQPHVPSQGKKSTEQEVG